MRANIAGLLIASIIMAGCTTASAKDETPAETPPATEAQNEQSHEHHNPAIGPVEIGQSIIVDGPKVTPIRVLEDSRCPTNVMCVWAGQVRLLVKVEGGNWSKELEISTIKPVQVADGTLTLRQVEPQRTIGKGPSGQEEGGQPALNPPPYKFWFSFAGGL